MSQKTTHRSSAPREAAAVVVLHPGDGHPVLLVKRSDTMRFMPGHHVFPGGRVDTADARIPLAGAPTTEDARFIVAAVRECFEEAGVLLTEGPAPEAVALDDARRALLTGERDFGSILTAFGHRIDGSRFRPIGLWVTPPLSPIRFFTRFYLYQAEDTMEATALPEEGEIVGVDWVTPARARQEWHHNTRHLSAPVAYVLHHLATMALEDAVPWLNAVPADEDGVATCFEFRRGIHLMPLESPTIAPATHTNTLLLGEEEMVVVDPGAATEEENQRLFDRLRHFEALGGRLVAIVLTHSHVDHVAGTTWLRSRREVPVWAHGETAAQLEFPVDRILTDGERIYLAGDPGWELECLHTPGHDPGHLALLEHRTGTLLAGDLLANPGTIVISPDWRGDMSDYLASLERCVELPFGLLIPGHGAPLFGRAGREALASLITHRLAREARIKEALEAGATTMPALLEAAYGDVGRESWPLAEHQARAHLLRLGVELE